MLSNRKNKKVTPSLLYLIMSLELMTTGIALMLSSNDINVINELSKTLTYSKLVLILGFIIIMFGLSYLGLPIDRYMESRRNAKQHS